MSWDWHKLSYFQYTKRYNMQPPNITNKQQEIPSLLGKLRFLNRFHFQLLLKHKDKRRINKWLKDLTKKNYIVNISDTNDNHVVREENEPAIYRIGLNGIRFLKTQDKFSARLIKNLYRENERSAAFINQCLLLADIYLTLQNQDKNGVVYTATIARDFVDSNSPFHFLTELNPQMCFVKQERHKEKKYYLLEVFAPTLPNFSVKKRLKTYIEFFWSNEWENNIDGNFPIILLVCPTKPKLKSAKLTTKKLFEEEQDPEGLHIRFTTIDQIKESNVTGEIWEEVK